MCECAFCQEFKLQYLTPAYPYPQVFILSQYQKVATATWCYFVYRCIIFVIFLYALLSSLIDRNSWTWFAYLTHWGLVFLIVQAGLALYLVGMSKRDKKQLNLKVFCTRVYWVFFTLAFDGAIFISMVYWGFVYDGTGDIYISIVTHVLNTVIMIIEFVVVSHPVRLLHVVYVEILAIVYCAFTYVYYIAGGKATDGSSYLYKILDWGNPTNVGITMIGVVIVILFIHFFKWIFYIIKNTLFPISYVLEDENEQ